MWWLSLFLSVLVLGPALAVARLTPELREVMLEEHNCARRNKGVPELVWDDSLAKSAQDWANRCTTDHSGMGENLSFACCNVQNPPQFLKSAVKGWLDEGKYWNCKDDTCSPQEGSRCLHFTQAMWEESDVGGSQSARGSGQTLSSANTALLEIGSERDPFQPKSAPTIWDVLVVEEEEMALPMEQWMAVMEETELWMGTGMGEEMVLLMEQWMVKVMEEENPKALTRVK
ncbi:hypothetical protein QOT17_020753 [Balamuthia mandrillaris]